MPIAPFQKFRTHKMLDIGIPALFLVRVTGLAASTALGLGIAKWLGSDATGIYYLFLSGALGGGLLARRGLDAVTLKYIAISNSEGSLGRAYGQWVYCCAKASVYAVILIAAALTCWAVFPSSALQSIPPGVVWCVMIAIPFHAMHMINVGALRGLGRQIFAAILEILIIPLIVILGIASSLILDSADKYTAIIYYTMGLCAAFSIGALTLWRFLRGSSIEWPEPRDLKSVSKSFFAVGISAFIIEWSATYILMAFADVESIGIYNTCFRIVAVGGLVLTIFNNLHAPDFAIAFKSKDFGKVARVARSGAQACFIVGCMILGPVLLFPYLVLGFIGEEFLVGAPILRVMIGAQLVNMFTGSVGYLLLMSGHEKSLERISYACLVVQVGAMLPAIYWFGMYGAALTWALVGISRNFMAMYIVRKKTGVLVVPEFIYFANGARRKNRRSHK